MSTVQMNPQQATAWAGEIESLNARLRLELDGVNTSVDTIGRDAAGSIVGQLTQNASQMMDSAANVINAFTGLVGAVGDLVGEASNLISTLGENLPLIGALFG